VAIWTNNVGILNLVNPRSRLRTVVVAPSKTEIRVPAVALTIIDPPAYAPSLDIEISPKSRSLTPLIKGMSIAKKIKGISIVALFRTLKIGILEILIKQKITK
jgi:hypothetical protein